MHETRPDVYLKVVASLFPRAPTADETSAIQVHHVIKRIIIHEGQTLELEAIHNDGDET